jgi:hypothetical protein
LQAALRKFPKLATRYLQAAGVEAHKRVILQTPGIKYPPMTDANRPPVPYYIRGRGTQTAHGNLGNSERLGTQWYTKPAGTGTWIGNRASYAQYVHGDEDEQAKAMAAIGWKRLIDVINARMPEIVKVYQAWVNKLLVACGLK